MELVRILGTFSKLELDGDLFYLEIPLGKAGCWVSERSTGSGVNVGRINYQDYTIYYRGKNKKQLEKNLKYLDNIIDNMEACKIDGRNFALDRLYGWDYVGQDSEGYFVFENVIRVL